MTDENEMIRADYIRIIENKKELVKLEELELEDVKLVMEN